MTETTSLGLGKPGKGRQEGMLEVRPRVLVPEEPSETLASSRA